jgi:MFS family permease
MLVGTLIAGMFAKHSRGPLLLWASAVLGICTMTIGLLHHLWLIAAMLFIMGTTSGLVSVNISAWFQQRVDRTKLGRVASVAMFASIGLMPVSLAVAGVLIQWSPVLMFALAGASVLIVTSLAAVQKTVREIQ